MDTSTQGTEAVVGTVTVRPSFLHYLEHFALAAVGFAIPFLITNYPAVANLTLGAVLTTGLDYLKHVFTE